LIGKRPAALAAVVTAATMIPLALFGGVGFAKTLASASEYQYGPSHNQYKITICHHAGKHGKRVTITVSANALKGHKKHGDEMGPCPAQAPKHPAPVVPVPPTTTTTGDDSHGKSGSHGNNGNGKAHGHDK
jgi:hypothetical protein